MNRPSLRHTPDVAAPRASFVTCPSQCEVWDENPLVLRREEHGSAAEPQRTTEPCGMLAR